MRTISILAILTATLGAQDVMWAPKARKPGAYVAPHKPHTKIADLKAKHAGHAEWRELVVDDEHLRSEWIQAKPGAKEPRQLHPDTRAWWVVMEGQIRFDIEGTAPFVASKGSIVQVPMQTLFSFETIGDQPSLRFETNIHGAKTLHTTGAEPPRIAGFDMIRVKFPNRAKGVYGRNNKPHTTFDELAKGIDEGRLKGTIRVVEDDRGAANFIYGYNAKLPPLDPKAKGHYHAEGAEYWLIMAGKIRYPIEGQGVVIADVGDVVYVPKFTFHFPRWWGDGASCRLAMNGYPYISHLFEE
jgi:mannose-6-phosphate isomerase-like protein (cupin superfamily)